MQQQYFWAEVEQSMRKVLGPRAPMGCRHRKGVETGAQDRHVRCAMRRTQEGGEDSSRYPRQRQGVPEIPGGSLRHLTGDFRRVLQYLGGPLVLQVGQAAATTTAQQSHSSAGSIGEASPKACSSANSALLQQQFGHILAVCDASNPLSDAL